MVKIRAFLGGEGGGGGSGLSLGSDVRRFGFKVPAEDCGVRLLG